jgi:hypothetical protein
MWACRTTDNFPEGTRIVTATGGAKSPDDNEFKWLRFVARSEEHGRLWVEEYRRPEVRAAEVRADEALALLRRRHLEEGRAELRCMEDLLGALTVTPSIRYVLDRWYFGILAYYEYAIEDFDAAGESLRRADAAVVAALSIERTLIPLANHCQEFRLHQVRIARNRRRWQEMRQHIEVALAMTEERLPLCLLADGTTVGFPEIVAFYDSIPDFTEEEREVLSGMLDPVIRRRIFHRFVAEIYAFPGFVIPYRAGRAGE